MLSSHSFDPLLLPRHQRYKLSGQVCQCPKRRVCRSSIYLSIYLFIYRLYHSFIVIHALGIEPPYTGPCQVKETSIELEFPSLR
jgi:hypothetical protein